jgi:DNA-binding response OmpR family regulator
MVSITTSCDVRGRARQLRLILDQIWGSDLFGGSRTVDAHIRRLRAKLGPDHEALIGTIRNVGYRAAQPGTVTPPHRPGHIDPEVSARA